LTVNARTAGPRLGKDVQAAIKAVKAGAGVLNPDGTLTAGPATLLPEEYSSKLVAAEPEWTAPLPDGAGLVVLDGTVTPELEAEGWAKDRIRELQELRKTTGLDVSDRIRVVIAVPAERETWARTHADLIAGEILATSFEFGDVADGAELGDGVKVAIVKA
jgi:isoleucyl-tRNA synthetase